MLRRLLQPIWVLLAVIFLIEAWLWDHLEPIVAWAVAKVPLRAFKHWLAERVDTLSPAMTLIVFAVPVIPLFPLKLIGLWLLANEYWASAIILISTLLLMASAVWALYDEAYGQRPWRGTQREFTKRYTAYLKSIRKDAGKSEAEVKETPEYQQLADEANASLDKVKSDLAERDKQVAAIQARFAKATAPNFTLAKERLKPGWTKRWMLDPALIAPGTAMPSGLFKRDGDHWVFAGPTPSSLNGYPKDHADLLVRYMFQFTPDELNRLRASAGSGAGR